MLILPETQVPALLESVLDPIPFNFYWTFSAKQLDFFLSPIIYLEEYVGPTITLRVDECAFSVPASWYIMICDQETTFIDFLPAANLLGQKFDAFSICLTDSRARYSAIHVGGLNHEEKLVYPVVQRGSAMLHPTGISAKDGGIQSCVISPFDLFQKRLEPVTVGDVMF